MKKLIAFTVFVVVLLTAVTAVSAADKQTVEDITFSVGPEFTVHTSSELLPSSEVDGLLFVAMTKDESHQIQARCTETEFSKQLVTFQGLDQDIIAPVGKQLFPDGYETTEINSMIFIKSTVTGENGYTSIYITVNDGKLYTFTYFGQDATKMGEFMTTVKLPLDSAGAGINVYIIMLIAIFIIADIVLIAFLTTSFVKDYRRRKMEANENVVSQYIKIKRRKF